MRIFKLLTVFALAVSMIGLAACSNGDLSGTAGDVPQPEKTEVPGDDPERPEEPGGEEPAPGVVEPGSGSGSTKPGGSTSPGGPGAGEPEDLAGYLAQKADERIDLAQIEKDCGACMPEAEQLFEDIEALCEADAAACTPEYQVFVTKERTAAQVRNEQNTVGFPTGDQLIEAIALIEERGAEGAAEPKEGVELPSREKIELVANIVTNLEGTGTTDATWADIATAAGAAPDGTAAVADIEAGFVAVANGDIVLEGCDADCMAILGDLLGGKTRPVEEISELLDKFAEASR